MSIVSSLFALDGVVTPYDKNGRALGYPTANIQAPVDAPDGVYVGTVTRNNIVHPAMIFIGTPITMKNQTRRAEAHILDFPDQDLYDETLRFELLRKIRSNKKYDSIEELIDAIKSDERITRDYFKKHSLPGEATQ